MMSSWRQHGIAIEMGIPSHNVHSHLLRQPEMVLTPTSRTYLDLSDVRVHGAQ